MKFARQEHLLDINFYIHEVSQLWFQRIGNLNVDFDGKNREPLLRDLP